MPQLTRKDHNPFEKWKIAEIIPIKQNTNITGDDKILCII